MSRPKLTLAVAAALALGCGAAQETPRQTPLPEIKKDVLAKIKQALRKNASPHHVPDEIIVVKQIPLTLTGKKTEVPVKKLLMGVPVEKAVSRDALSNPEAIAYFITFAQKVRAEREASQSEG